MRAVTEALEGFDANDQERIIRWARKKIGLSVVPVTPPTPSAPPPGTLPASPAVPGSAPATKDLKSFVAEKKPKNDVQFAATVAYYIASRLQQINEKLKSTAMICKKVADLSVVSDLRIPTRPFGTPHTLGLLNKGGQSGHYGINSVGENLVAVTLPGDGAPLVQGRRARRRGTLVRRLRRSDRNMNPSDEAIYAAIQEAQLLRKVTKKKDTLQVQGC